MMQARRTSGDMSVAIGTFASLTPGGTKLLECPQGVSTNNKYSSKNFHGGVKIQDVRGS